ncbi:MAG: hypothetical protein SNJ78_09890 [Spirochaetales bacterium]
MTCFDLKSLLEERLTFYNSLMDRLKETIDQEEIERLSYYQGLEQETLKSIASLEKCIAALCNETTATPLEKELEIRIANARKRALEAAQSNCSLLKDQLEQIKSKISKVKGKYIPLSYEEILPALLDLDI